jgi:uncharacterized protein YbbC (DUF1343 family)
MAKKKSRTSQTSKGEQGHPRRCKTSVGIKRWLNQQKAWSEGKRVMLVVNAAGHKVEARQVWGLPPQERRKANNDD